MTVSDRERKRGETGEWGSVVCEMRDTEYIQAKSGFKD